jgi:hypothetical protein
LEFIKQAVRRILLIIMRNLLILLLIFPFISAFSQKNDSLYFDVTLFKETEDIIIIDTPYEFSQEIPPGKMRDTTYIRNDTFLVKALSEDLKSAGEKPFFNNALRKNYRFTWLRSFHKQIIINVYEDKNVTKIETKWFSRYKGIDSMKIKTISKNDIKEFEKLLDKNDFWADQQVIVSSCCYIDGSRWLLEGRKKKYYRFLFSRSPDLESKIRKISEWLIMKSDAANETRIY